MTSTEPQPDVLPPNPPGFQYSLRTLLLLFVVLASSLGVFGGWGIAVFAISVGLAVWIQHAESLPSLGCLVLVVLGLLFLAGLLLPAVMASRNLAVRMQCLMNVKQIALALQSYETVNGCFPPAYIADKNGKPMHSWRVLILPYLEEDALYKAYDFTEPWDGPKNKKLLATCPKEFVCPSDPRLNTSGGTAVNYVAVVGRNAAWAGAKPRKLADFTAGLSSTVMLVEVADSGIG